jgi:hypothetical protein
MNTSTILVTQGLGPIIRDELPSARVRKVHDGEPEGEYGDHIFRCPNADAVKMKLKYPSAVRIL